MKDSPKNNSDRPILTNNIPKFLIIKQKIANKKNKMKNQSNNKK